MKYFRHHDVLSFPADSHRSIHEQRFPIAPPLAAVGKAAACTARAAAFALLLGAGLPIAAQTNTPYSGTPIAVPGSFEAEDFDLGGEGVACHDNVPGDEVTSQRTLSA